MRLRPQMLLAFVLAASACAGPRVPLDVGVKEFPTDIILGSQTVDAPPEIVAVLQAPIPVPVPPPVAQRGVVSPDPTPTPEPCPAADPLGNPKRELRGVRTLPPKAAGYEFGLTGKVKAGATELPLPPVLSRKIANVAKEPSGIFTFDVDGGFFTTTYRVVPQGAGGEAGVFMTKQTFKTTPPRTFTPTPSIKLLPFPVENGASWDVVGTDVSTQTSWIIHGTVGVFGPDPNDPEGPQILNPTIRVDACGEWLEGWAVRITGPNNEGSARIISPTMDLDFNATFGFATQYGSLGIFDHTILDGTVSGQPFSYDSKASIRSEPAVPEGA